MLWRIENSLASAKIEVPGHPADNVVVVLTMPFQLHMSECNFLFHFEHLFSLRATEITEVR
jgi:hypothetical protein